jgi:sarcosine/dimethylglycine N-methyltransferase
MPLLAADALDLAQKHYDSADANAFYSSVWGGEDIHIGIYDSPVEPIANASQRTVREMAAWLPDLTSDYTVVDIGAGDGGAARFLARTYGCRVTCVNLSGTQNSRNRKLNEKFGLEDKVEVLHGCFEHLPVPSNTYDVVWSQDAILHSGDRLGVLREVRRVLRPGGRFIFTDPMQADNCPPGVLDPVYARWNLADLSSPRYYRTMLAQLGFRELKSLELTEHLVHHYSRVRDELERRSEELGRYASEQYLASMKTGLKHWIEAARQGRLHWGIYCFIR